MASFGIFFFCVVLLHRCTCRCANAQKTVPASFLCHLSAFPGQCPPPSRGRQQGQRQRPEINPIRAIVVGMSRTTGINPPPPLASQQHQRRDSRHVSKSGGGQADAGTRSNPVPPPPARKAAPLVFFGTVRVTAPLALPRDSSKGS